VPWEAVLDGFGQDAKPYGTRATGLVYNYLPWLLSAFKANGNPEPEPQLEVRANEGPLTLARGAKTLIGIRLRNSGSNVVENLRMSFHTRLDFKTTATKPVPDRLSPGQTAECWYEVEAPKQVNLACECDRIAYGHWSALYRRGDRAHLGHRWIKISLKEE
jgi:hypothetical protein